MLGLDLWSEPFIPAVVGSGGPEHQLGARPTNVELFREGGIDPALYEEEPGIRLTLQLEGGGRDRGSSMEEDAPLSAFTMYRDHDYLDSDTLRAAAAQERPSAFIFNAWHEAWGKHRWFPAEDDDQARDLAVMGGEPAEGIFRVNSEYPADGFWWDSQLRITPAFPAPPHFLEPYAHALAELDALEITRGGLFLDKAHTGEIATFARAYRTLPAVTFEQVGTSNDPVAVRTALVDGQRYVYAVNRDNVEATVELSLGNSPCALTDLVTGESIEGDVARFELGSYELRSFTCTCTDAPTSARVTLPDDARQAVEQDAEAALIALARARESGRSIPGADTIERGIVAAVEEGRFAWLRRALTSYPVLVARQAMDATA